ncbi:hypothetical protein J3F83DRAFT_718771 [Trichoderma novae-zelandiae]
MAELVYHNGHYHHVSNRDRHRPRRNDDWGLIKLWDEVLYSIGDVYYKRKRRSKDKAEQARGTARPGYSALKRPGCAGSPRRKREKWLMNRESFQKGRPMGALNLSLKGRHGIEDPKQGKKRLDRRLTAFVAMNR